MESLGMAFENIISQHLHSRIKTIALNAAPDVVSGKMSDPSSLSV